jgi:hypothetical protein
MALKFKLKPEGFDIKKMLKKAGKVGITAAGGTIGLEQMTDAATQAAQSVDFGNGIWAGLASAVLTCAVNYLGQAIRRG